MSKKYISKEVFDEINIGDSLEIRYMRGSARVVSKPYANNIIIDGNPLITQVIKVKFEEGPWMNKILTVIRSQVKKIN
jgi:hypothetical protein